MKFKYTIKDDQYVIINDEEKRYKVYQIDESNLEEHQNLFDRYLSLLASEHDLEYVKAYIDQMFFSQDTTLIDGALINSAIQLLIKCFTNPTGKGRHHLNAKKVFDKYAKSISGNSYLTQYLAFYNIRRRSLAHDDNDFRDNLVGLTIDSQECKPVEITYIRVRSRFLYRQNAKILKEMILIALEYINIEKKQIEEILIKHYCSKPFSEISKYKVFDCRGIELFNCW